ncbi:hypothetical protein [Luteibacter yeojuensis]|uniref:Uncharacterized protein n=1 Tax=Luteibacter yeojuensis TaxID=345309 RepID=A0A0F3KZZ9_9GAMM|nr:hypothetical protein [Luteibacter yeojuensis]KJV36721.1 hypothetical protein VI08_02830 [Luteibacter yeojuensis]
MKAWAFIGCLALAGAAVADPAPRPHLVTRVEATDAAANRTGIVRFFVTNDGDSTAYTGKNQLPTVNEDGKLRNPIMKVTRGDGTPLTYFGIFDEGSSGPEVIEPGTTRTYEVDIARNFDISAGLHRIQFDSFLYFDQPAEHRDAATMFISDKSNTVEVWFTNAAGKPSVVRPVIE